MLIIVEGIDRIGKTTFCKKLEKLGFTYIKDAFMTESPCKASHMPYSYGKLDTTLKVLTDLVDQGKDVVVDRLHLTEIVYSLNQRDLTPNLAWMNEYHMKLMALGAILVLFRPNDITRSCIEAGMDMREHDKCFSSLFKHFKSIHTFSARDKNLQVCESTKSKWALKYLETDYLSMDEVVKLFAFYRRDHILYFASPFFREDQVEREERLKAHLRDLGFSLYSPKEECHLSADATQVDQQKVFSDNLEAIKKCSAVFAITDGKDIGTIWESGYAFGIRKPVLYYAETLGQNQFNLMLAKSGNIVYREMSEVTQNSVIDSILGKTQAFEGLIE